MANLECASERAVSFEFLKDFIHQHVPKHYTTLEVMTNIIVPATVSNKTAYSKIIPVSKIGKPSFFVSHRWGCKFWFIFEMIEEYMTNNPNLDSHTTFFWIDIFAVNQHPGTEQQEDLKQLARAIDLSSKTLLCMDETGEVLTRIWCLYEIWKTIECKGSAAYLTVLLSSLNQTQVQKIFLSFHVTQAQATVAEDRDRILKEIEDSVGTQQMSLQIKEALDQSSEEEIKMLENIKAGVPLLVKSLEKCTQLKRMAGKYLECEQYAAKAVQICRESNDNQHLASALLLLGHAFHFQNKFEESEKAYGESLEIRKNTGEEDLDYTRTLDGLANSKSRLGKFEESENYLKTSLEIRQKIVPNSHFIGCSLNNLAILYWHQTKYEQAKHYFQESLKFLEQNGHDYLTVDVKFSLGLIALIESRFGEAEKVLLEVLEERKKIHGQEHPTVAAALNALGQAALYQERVEEATELTTQALEMRKKLLGPDHLEVKHSEKVLSDIAAYNK